MSQIKKSAKDLAFEKERAKHRAQMREVQQKLLACEERIRSLETAVRERDSLLAEKDDWIRRLLDYTEMTPEDLKVLIQKEKDTAEVMSNLTDVQRILKDLW